MRFPHAKPTTEDLARVGARRTVRRFLFLPTTIGDETRWMEATSILQECRLVPDPMFPGLMGMGVLQWENLAWADTTTT